ncbi:MAG: ubiquinol-cytochrome C chaperone [Rhodospirillaceae bacterium]|jgi:cytochrome b pre-mRNA-processing protein 3|nr:ubiquinol-cytochrome C chaperone [Rhodospirillaceae bacterium]MBT5753118.1 ubiquinol-cytochrome C chaperone [Rhodospirillaceae bacterium]
MFLSSPYDFEARTLYEAIVAQARAPGFYTEMKVPDTVEGRFDMIALHCFLVLHRLKSEGEKGGDLAQSLFDVLFADLDENIREMGVGDLSVGKYVKKMAKSFLGQIAAYDAALYTEEKGGLDVAGGDLLASALSRNVYAAIDVPRATIDSLSDYLRGQVAVLADQPIKEFLSGRVTFATTP